MRVLYVGGSGYVRRLAVPLLRQRFAVRVFDLRPPACATAAADVAAAIAAALGYRDGLQIFTISAGELAGRWSAAKARDLLAWHPRFTPPP